MKHLLALTALLCSLAIAQAPTLIVKHAWARQAPGSDVAAVYLSLTNTSLKPVVVIGVQSPLANHSMVHETAVVAGQSQMRMREKIVIAPGQTVNFAPGGTHIMLSGLKRGVAVGQSVPLILLLADGGRLTVAAVAKPLGSH